MHDSEVPSLLKSITLKQYCADPVGSKSPVIVKFPDGPAVIVVMLLFELFSNTIDAFGEAKPEIETDIVLLVTGVALVDPTVPPTSTSKEPCGLEFICALAMIASGDKR